MRITVTRSALAGVLVALATGCAACGGTTTPSTTTTTLGAIPSSDSLTAPHASPADVAKYLADVTVADPALTSYEQKWGNTALRALLTDGSAFCAFLQRDKDVDSALVSVAVGARGLESQTHLPSNVTTFNTVEATALLTLCPSEQRFVPASVRSKIRALGASFPHT